MSGLASLNKEYLEMISEGLGIPKIGTRDDLLLNIRQEVNDRMKTPLEFGRYRDQLPAKALQDAGYMRWVDDEMVRTVARKGTPHRDFRALNMLDRLNRNVYQQAQQVDRLDRKKFLKDPETVKQEPEEEFPEDPYPAETPTIPMPNPASSGATGSYTMRDSSKRR